MKRVLYIGIVVLIGIMFFVQRCNNSRLLSQIQLQKVLLAEYGDSVYTFRTKSDELVHKINSIEIEKKNLKEALEIIEVEKKELKESNIKLNKLVSVLKFELETKGEGITQVRDTFIINKTDTIRYTKINNWSDNHLSLFDMKIMDNQFNFNYRYNIGLKFFTEKYKNETIVTVKTNNPNTVLSSANSISISTKKKWYESPLLSAAGGFTLGALIFKNR